MIRKLFFIFLFASLVLSAQIKVGFLNIDNAISKNAEVKAAFNFLKKQKKFSAEKINYNDFVNSQFSIQQFSIIWIHRPNSTELISQETDPRLISALQNYVKNGGNLFLTLDAMKYLNALGFESEKPQVRYAEAIDDGYGRKLGLHSFRSHSIFEGLNGGAYIFNPANDMKTRQLGFFDDSVPRNGKVVAVDWAYIMLKENSKLAVEYEVGKGKILAVGAYTYYGIENNNRAHLELFTNNCLNYLGGKYKNGKKYYWNYSPPKVLPFTSKPSNDQDVKITSSQKWKMNYDSMTLVESTATKNSWDVAGERMLVMGKENGGIDEIWAHPFMALRDYEVGIIFNDKDSVRWLKNYTPKVEVRPESFTRIYDIEKASLTEIITASITQPYAVIHYEFQGDVSAKLIVKFISNMRYMWPYSEKALGSIYYSWDDKLSSFIIKDASGDFSVIAGANRKPSQQVVGQFENFEKAGSLIRGIETNKFFVGASAQYDLKKNDNLDFIITATNEGLTKAKEEHRTAVENPEKIYNQAVNLTRDFLNQSLMITTPDKDFNQGYRWALIGTNRFFVNTPGLGKSLVAGYSTTATGWDGGHKVNGRPGYAWYFGRDGVWSSLALLDYGDFEKVKSILEFFNKYQDLNGKIFHELTTSGAVHYDAADATPLYIILAGEYLHHTGDVEFIKQNWQHIKRAINFCYSTDTDGDHLIENTNVGHGWVEGGGLYTAHTEVYLAACWSEALRQASYMVEKIGLNDERKKYYEEFETVKKIINTDFWEDKDNFLSFSKLKDGTFNHEKTVLAAVPVYFDMLDSAKVKKVIDAYAENYFSSDWGVRILREDSPIFNPQGYHTGSVWPLFTGWSALAEYKYGNYAQGFSHVMNNLLVYKNWALGFVEEVLNGAEYKPGGVCPHQCWSETMVLQPAIEGMLGLKVDALTNEVKFSPRFPADWDSVKVERIKIGNCFVNFTLNRSGGKIVYEFSSNLSKELMIDFNPALPLGIKIVNATINGKPTTFEQLSNGTIHLSFKFGKVAKVVIEFTGGISVLPIVSYPTPNDKSEGFRILSERIEGNNFFVTAQGMSGSTNNLKIYRDGEVEKMKVEFEKSDNKYINKIVTIKIER